MKNYELMDGYRALSDSEIAYRVTNSMQTAQEINRLLKSDNKVTIYDVVEMLTPARMEMAFALLELFQRISAKKLTEKIRASKDAYNLMKPVMDGLEVEECWCIFLNQSLNVTAKVRISKGGFSSTQVDVRVILKSALKYNATAMVLIHNHPSGNPKPSVDDDRLTQALSQAGKVMNIRLTDHVIYTDGDYYSYADEGRL
ncbi:JAB domain-containing protein [Phocaeicola barnesiae]